VSVKEQVRIWLSRRVSIHFANELSHARVQLLAKVLNLLLVARIFEHEQVVHSHVDSSEAFLEHVLNEKHHGDVAVVRALGEDAIKLPGVGLGFAHLIVEH
jgi:hypothetical protein